MTNGPELQPKPEKIPFLQMEAVKRVSVKDYLRLRYTRGWTLASPEYLQIDDTEAAVRVFTNDTTYSVAEYIPISNVFRAIVTRMPLPQYLAGRHEYLQAAITSVKNMKDTSASHEDQEGAVEAEERLKILEPDIQLTEMVAAAANVSLSLVI